MATFGTLQEFCPDEEGIAAYIERVEVYFKANDIAENKQVPVFLSVVGGRIYSLLRDLLAPEKPDTKSFKELTDVLLSHFGPKPVVIAERFYFHSRSQKPTESIAQFLAELRRLATYCEFKDHLDDALRDRLVCGLANRGIQRRLLSEPNLTLTSALEIAQGIEAADQNARKLNKGDSEINRVNTRTNDKPARKPCYRCGGTDHAASSCRFIQATCHKCQKRGHIARVCRSGEGKTRISTQPKVPETKKTTHSIQEEQSTDLTLFTVNKPSSSEPITLELEINGQKLPMELDTGAAVSLISTTTKERIFPDVPLINTPNVLTTYTGERMAVMGKMKVEVRYDSKVYNLQLHVVDGDGPSLFGRDWLLIIQLDWKALRVSKVLTSKQSLEALLDRHQEVFEEGLGKMNTFEASLHLKPKASPKFLKARPVPFALKEAIEVELDRLEAAGIIEKITHSPWAAPIVPVPKGDGKLRLCGDYKVTVNPMLDIDQYPLPKPDDLMATLAGGKRFSKIDLTNAYQQMTLEKQSRDLVTINTHKGLYRYTRLPFGVASAPAIFQKTMDTVLQGLPKVICYLDDILITGSTDEEHLENVEKVLERLKKYGIRAKRQKCSFLSSSVEYLGHCVDATGLHTTPDKVEAVQKAPTPCNVQELRSFLGLVHYYGKFLHNLSTLLHPLNVLLKDGQSWEWTPQCEQAFQKCKKLLSTAPVLAHFDPGLPLKMAGDASAYGIGAVISHTYPDGKERPIAYASRTLSSSERNYSQIEKEALSLIFGVKKFHTYLYGRKFTLVTDHKPLTTVLGPKNGIPPMAAARLQRWALLLSAYSYDIEFKRTQDHANADGLSRLPQGDRQPPNTASAFLIGQIQALPVTAQQLAVATRQDPILGRIHGYIRNGWPASTSEEYQPFRDRQQQLSTEGQIVLWGNRVIIPEKLRPAILKELHRNHPGITRMKGLARSYLWWPGLDKDMEQYVAQCEACQAVRNSPAPAPLHPWLWPTKPWRRIHIDFAGPVEGKMYLIVVDAHSKWPEVIAMNSTTSTQTIIELRRLFSMYGLPQQLVSDNGPQFTSEEFATFCKMNGVKHIRCSPYHPSSNGLAERFVQTFKRAMKTSCERGITFDQRLCSFLLQYRCTPHSTTNTPPCELFMGRTLRTRLDLLRPSQEDRVQAQQEMQKLQHDQHVKERELAVGQTVFAKNFRAGPDWVTGVIKKVLGPLTYLVEVEQGQCWKRHIDHLRLYQGSRNDAESTDILIYPSREITDMPNPEPAPAEHDTVHQDEVEGCRYPVRERHAPDRLM